MWVLNIGRLLTQQGATGGVVGYLDALAGSGGRSLNVSQMLRDAGSALQVDWLGSRNSEN